MTPEEIDALTLGGYLPFDCPRCDRRRLEFFLNSDGGLCYCKCEKCGANSEDDSLSPTSGTYLPDSVVPATEDACEGPDDCDAHHPCQRHAAEANAGRFKQR